MKEKLRLWLLDLRVMAVARAVKGLRRAMRRLGLREAYVLEIDRDMVRLAPRDNARGAVFYFN